MADPKKVATILVLEGRYHFGNNPGVFQDATYVGLQLNLPITVTWYDENLDEVAFLFKTQDVESWRGSGGHQVLLNGTDVGRLSDPSDGQAGNEQFRIAIPTVLFKAILKGSKFARLGILVEVGDSPPGLADDFVLRRIETEENLLVRVGIQGHEPSHAVVKPSTSPSTPAKRQMGLPIDAPRRPSSRSRSSRPK